jgi:uncharacterized protein (TIGR00369 family)
MADPSPPEGFSLHTRSSPVTRPWEPIYAKITEESFLLALQLAEPHCNARGFAHGGVIAALADNAMGLSYGLKLGAPGGIVTVSLNLDYIGSGQIGHWLMIAPRVLKASRTTGFVDALVTANGALVARASAVFRNPA